MGSKTLMIRKVVYESLRKEKRRGESFSKVIDRLLSRRHPLQGLYGLWSPSRTSRRTRPRPRTSVARKAPPAGVHL